MSYIQINYLGSFRILIIGATHIQYLYTLCFPYLYKKNDNILLQEV